ncbi:MAG TPA: class I SAM-dependent methyltransferase [Thermoanaerobaculia bacterium]|nr:class I SAM-dependent methyltransferase [Thermoanaerobaculia bacterium]
MTFDFDSREFVDAYDELPLWSAMFGQLLLEHVPLRENSVALDVGCGTGFPLLELAQRLGPGSVVHALDPWIAALARAGRKRRQTRVDNARLHIGDAAAMPFRNDSFDLIVSNLGLNNFSDAPAAVAECRRVLRPTGTLALTTNLVGHMRELYEVFAAVLGESAALTEHIEHRATIDKVRALLGTHGFTVRTVHEDTFTMRYANGAALLHHTFVQFGFLPGWRAVVPAEDQERVFAELERRLSEIKPLTLTIPRAYIEAQ